MCEALDTAGVVIRVRDLVYLRPADVAQIVFEVLNMRGAQAQNCCIHSFQAIDMHVTPGAARHRGGVQQAAERPAG